MKLLLLMATLSWACFSFASVKITINDKPYYFTGNPKLSEVLEPIALDRPWDWRATTLFRLNNKAIEAQRTKILELLNKQDDFEEDALTIKSLIAEIQTWRLGTRVFIPIDFDLSRVQPEFNPKFEDGEYLLILKERATTVSVLGVAMNSGELKYKASVSVSHYLSEVNFAEGADKSFVYLIQSDGEIKKSGVAYWNNDYDHISPGGKIFIPLSESQFSAKIKDLNMKIAKLAANRIIK